MNKGRVPPNDAADTDRRGGVPDAEAPTRRWLPQRPEQADHPRSAGPAEPTREAAEGERLADAGPGAPPLSAADSGAPPAGARSDAPPPGPANREIAPLRLAAADQSSTLTNPIGFSEALRQGGGARARSAENDPGARVADKTRAHFDAGMAIGHYEVIRLLGKGGMGEVYLARDTRLGRRVALKFLLKADVSRSARFLVEARATAQLAHENIVALYDIAEHEGLPYMVLEYLPGKSLSAWLRERAEGDGRCVGLPPPRAAELMLPVARALVCAHEAGIVHRDLKPANIMLADSGTVKVLDFGIAKLLGDAPEEALDTSARPSEPVVTPSAPPARDSDAMAALTQAGDLLGTRAFMAPEQWRSEPVDQRADLWAVGIMLYQMVTGDHPLAPLSAEVLVSVAFPDAPMPSVREVLPDIGKLGAIIDRCLLKHKDDRLGSARELCAELETVVRPHASAPSEDGAEANPYAGLAAFQERDAARFFGREALVEHIVARLVEQPLLALVGSSGAGKSSLVRAGVIPALKRGNAWEAFVLRPGPRPLAALAELLLQHSWQRSSHSEDSPPSSRVHPLLSSNNHVAVVERLREEPGFLGVQMRSRARRRRERVLLFVDQLEEVYTLAPEGDREAFLACLAGAADDASSPLRLITSIRHDFLDRVASSSSASSSAFAELVSRGTVLVGPLGRRGLQRALVEPAAALSHRFESEALVTQMLDALADATSALPLLQFTATKLWEGRDRDRRVLTEASYRAFGGAGGALASHADSVLGLLSAEEHRLARALLLRLVTPERTRARVPLGELRELSVAPEAVERVIGCLIDARLLTVESGGEAGATVEIVHESLIAQWPQLARWLEDEQEETALLARLRRAAKDWEANGHADGLLWRGEAAEDAQRWHERLRRDKGAFLGQSEERFLRAVVALTARARRVRRRLIVGAFAVLAAAMAATSYLAWQQSVAKQAAELATLRARDAARLSVARLQSDDPTTQLALLRELEGTEPPPGWTPEARNALHAGVARVVFEGHGAPVYAVVFSPDGRRIASSSEDKTVRVWDADGSGEPLVLRGHTGDVVCVAFSPDGRRIASASYDNTLRIWNADGSGEPLVLHGHTDRVLGVAFSPDGRRIASGSHDGTVRVWSADGSGEPLVLRGHTGRVLGVAFSPDGRRVASTSQDSTVRLWNADGSDKPVVLSGHTTRVNSVAFSPDGRRVASASADKTVRVWNADGSGEPIVLGGYGDNVHGVAFSPDGRRIASASYDGAVRVWNADGSGEPMVLIGHSNGLYKVAFSPDGARVASASQDGTVRVWRIDDPEKTLVLRTPVHAWAVAFNADGRLLASGEDDGTVRVWSADGSGEPILLRGHAKAVYAVAFSPDGRRIVSGSADETVRVWTTDGSGQPIVLTGHTDTVYAVAFSPDGRRIASASADGTARVWNADGSAQPIVLASGTPHAYGVAFSPDGRHIALTASDKGVLLWNADGSGSPVVLTHHVGAFYHVAFSPDGSRVAAGYDDKTVCVWNADGSGKPIVLTGHTGLVNDVAFSPDGSRIASASEDKTVRLWNVDGSGEPLVLTGHTGTVDGLAFSPDGRSIASASSDKTVRIWRDLKPLDPDDPRLWTSTNHCLSAARRRDLLTISEELARALHERCLRRTAEAGLRGSAGP